MTADLFEHLSLRPDRPIYLQIIEAFRLAVARGALAPGDQIPSQRDLAQQLRVNPNTVQRAYREMEHLGLVETSRGLGTFISRDPGVWRGVREETARAELARFLDVMRRLGYGPDQIVGLITEAVRRADDAPTGTPRASTESTKGERHEPGDESP